MRGVAISLLLLAAAACGGRTGSSSGDGGGGGGGDDGGESDPGWDGGLLPPSGPGNVRCGSTTCGAGSQCCLVEQGAPASNGCGSLDQPTCNGTQDVRQCDEQDDCNPGEDCCYGVFTSPPSTIGSRCSAKGTCDPWIGCASNADCAGTDAGPCVAQRCRGDILQTCGLIPTEDCPP